MKRNVFLLLIALVFINCKRDDSVFSQYENATVPVVLGKGSLSLDAVQWNNVFVAKTNELYFTKMGESASSIYKMTYDGNTFKELQSIDFTNDSPHTDVYVNPDGNFLLFSSLMQEDESDTITDWNIWKSIRENGKWKQPVPFFKNNLEGNQFYPCLTDSGNLYFAMTPHGSGNSDLYVSEFKNGKYQLPEAISNQINTEQLEGDAFIAPDESYLIFAGFERHQNLGKSDLYISFNYNGKWSKPVWLGETINSVGYDGSPFVTQDGKYLIFTSSRGSTDDNTFFNHYIVCFNIEDWK